MLLTFEAGHCLSHPPASTSLGSTVLLCLLSEINTKLRESSES